MKKYLFIYEDMKNRILNGEFKSGEQLPFEKELCVEYETSKMTIKKAFDLLVEDGLIIKKRGVGTFIKDIDMKEIEKLIFAKQFMGLTTSNPEKKVTSKVLHFDIIKATPLIEKQLNIAPESFVYDIHRIRYADNQPIVVEKTYMPIDLVPGLTEKHLEKSLYQYIENELECKIQSSHRKITVRKADDDETGYLDLEKGDPVAVAEQVAYFDNGKAFEFSFSVHRYDHFSAQLIITK